MSSFSGSRVLALAAAVSAISGCASSLDYYNPSSKPDDMLAYVQAGKTNETFSLIVGVYDSQGKRVFGTESWVERDRWERIYIEPGRYRFVTLCQMGTSYAFPRFDAEIMAGKSYLITCRPLKTGGFEWSADPSIQEADIPRPLPRK